LVPKLQRFGNTWTQDKLERVRKYLVAYTTIMKERNHKFAYIDAFAGTGYHELKPKKRDIERSLFAEVDAPDVKAFLKGSARIALEVEPRFRKYVFIEIDPKKTAELEKLKDEFPDKAADIQIKTDEANACLKQMCKKSWKDHRAVLFIDPFGTQLAWTTLEAVGKTKAIDTWILFPVMAVNRLITKKLDIPNAWRARLDEMFGDNCWFDVFCPPRDSGFFPPDPEDRAKSADMKAIGNYFNQRLRTIFAGVADNPLTLRNKHGAPLFLLCFAAANPYAVKAALRIAQDILKQPPATTPALPFLDPGE